MKHNPFQVVKDFEAAVADYTGAPYCVAVNSCTNGLFLCLKYRHILNGYEQNNLSPHVQVPNKTYLSVPMQIKHAGFKVSFRQEDWSGVYELKPFQIYDSARRFTNNMYYDLFVQQYLDQDQKQEPEYMWMVTSHHWSKTLGIQQGGCILHNSVKFDIWARKARFDGRTEGVAPRDDYPILGWHMYMSPEIAAEGLVRLSRLPKDNPDLPWDDYPDLSKMEIFK